MALSASVLAQLRTRQRENATAFQVRPSSFAPGHVFTLSPSQKVAGDTIVNEDGVFFLTGGAGTGKSYLIHYLDSLYKFGNVNCATTGIAAQLIGGRTVYSWASIHPRLGAVKSGKADNRVRSTKIVKIDEISMGNEWLGMELFQRFAMCEYQPPKIVLVGDFRQLPPVEGTPLYKSPLWGAMGVKVLKLKEQHRQSDDGFISALNHIRVGKVSGEVLSLFKDCRAQTLPEDCVQLYALRATVDKVNQSRLDRLPGESLTVEWHIWKRTPDTAVDFQQFRFSPKLELKEGARIVMLNNDENERWVNGSTGEILSLPSEADEMSEGFVRVRLDKNSREVLVAPATEEFHGADGTVVASVRQYPMMLAWALTVHKAQGMSLDRVGVDLTRHFASGMTYVALSRARTKQGLFLVGNFNRIPVDPAAAIFD